VALHLSGLVTPQFQVRLLVGLLLVESSMQLHRLVLFLVGLLAVLAMGLGVLVSLPLLLLHPLFSLRVDHPLVTREEEEQSVEHWARLCGLLLPLHALALNLSVCAHPAAAAVVVVAKEGTLLSMASPLLQLQAVVVGTVLEKAVPAVVVVIAV
jgi:hypothetical protein